MTQVDATELLTLAPGGVLAGDQWRPKRSSRVWAIAIVFFLHAVLLMLMHLERSRSLPISLLNDHALTVVIVPEPRVEPPRLPQERVEKSALQPARAKPLSSPRIKQPAAVQSGSESPGTPHIDWHGEIGRVAKEAAESASKKDLNLPCKAPRKFDEPPQTNCRPQPAPFEWDPEQPLAGLAGLLPFVRLGKRCVIGLGFFGCGIGKLPEPNGELFKSMNDPDRPRSSVPDSNEQTTR
ncbi:MAG: hypothetical protein ACJ8MH_14275 [Povalibacter sp.]